MVYFPKGGKVNLNLKQYNQHFDSKWISVATGEWGKTSRIKGGSTLDLETPDEQGWFVVLTGDAQ